MAEALKENDVKHTVAGEMPDPSHETARRIAADASVLSPRLWGWRGLAPVFAIGAVAIGYFFYYRR